MRMCSVDGCEKKHLAKGFCRTHYYRIQRNGSIGINRPAPGECLAFLERVATTNGDECITWPFWQFSNGYGGITIAQKKKVASRVVCEMAHGPVPDQKMQAAHICGNRLCVNPNHIRWATVAENHADKIKHGTTNRGERHGAAVLTEKQVVWARRECERGIQIKEIAEKLRKHPATVWAAVKGPNWRFVDQPKPQPKQEAFDV